MPPIAQPLTEFTSIPAKQKGHQPAALPTRPENSFRAIHPNASPCYIQFYWQPAHAERICPIVCFYQPYDREQASGQSRFPIATK
jgi:hypothetical protein